MQIPWINTTGSSSELLSNCVYQSELFLPPFSKTLLFRSQSSRIGTQGVSFIVKRLWQESVPGILVPFAKILDWDRSVFLCEPFLRHLDTTATLCFTVLGLDKNKLIYHINFHRWSENDAQSQTL